MDSIRAIETNQKGYGQRQIANNVRVSIAI